MVYTKIFHFSQRGRYINKAATSNINNSNKNMAIKLKTGIQIVLQYHNE